MKKIEDYLHLYLGCKCIANGREAVVDSIGRHPAMNTATIRFTDSDDDTDWTVYNDLNDFKLILRPISDINKYEAQDIYLRYFGNTVAEDWTGDNGSAYFNPKKVTPTKEHAIRIINGQDYTTGDFLEVSRLTIYLLSKHFDLFGLIEAGLAIDSTTINSKINNNE